MFTIIPVAFAYLVVLYTVSIISQYDVMAFVISFWRCCFQQQEFKLNHLQYNVLINTTCCSSFMFSSCVVRQKYTMVRLVLKYELVFTVQLFFCGCIKTRVIMFQINTQEYQLLYSIMVVLTILYPSSVTVNLSLRNCLTREPNRNLTSRGRVSQLVDCQRHSTTSGIVEPNYILPITH